MDSNLCLHLMAAREYTGCSLKIVLFTATHPQHVEELFIFWTTNCSRELAKERSQNIENSWKKTQNIQWTPRILHHSSRSQKGAQLPPKAFSFISHCGYFLYNTYLYYMHIYLHICIFISQSESFSHNLSRIKKAVLFVSLSVCQSCSVASSRLPRRRVYCVAEPLNNLKTHKNLIKQPLKIIIKIIIIIIICPSIRSVLKKRT